MKKYLTPILAVILLGTTTAYGQEDTAAIAETDTAMLEYADEFLYEKTDYFDTSSALNIDTTEDYTGFDLLKPAIDKGYRVYFTGENHTFTESNSLLQLKMFKYLHKNAGVNTLFMEFGFSRGYYVNQYVQTGDTTMLDVLRGYSFLEFADMYKGLMEYNKTLPEGEKIKVIGIDVERHFPLAVKTMSVSLPDNPPPTEIMLQVESLRGLSRFYDEQAKKKLESEDTENDEVDYSSYYSYTGYSAANTMDDIIENFKEHDSIYRVYLKDKYELYKRIALGLELRKKWDEYTVAKMPQAYVFREQYMYKEFMRNLKENPNDNFFAQFGRCHVSVILQEEACNWHEYNSIAQRLNNSTDSTIRGKVCTMAIFYPNDASDKKMAREYDCIDAYMDAAADSGMTIFNIIETEDSCANLYKQYQYVIINRHKANPAYFGIPEITETLDEETPETKKAAMISFMFTQRSFDFKNINNHFGNYANAPKLAEERNSFGFNFHNILDNGSSIRTDFNFFDRTTLDLTNNSSITFSSYSVGFSYGKDIFSNSFFDLVPHLGMQFGNIGLKYQADTSLTSSSGSLFGEKTTIYYSNPYSAFEANITMLYRLNGVIGIGAQAGYIYDISKKHWKLNDEDLNDVPNQSASGYYAGIMLTLDFSNRKPKPTYEDYYEY